jgi:L-threonylcarbamoyladenylate synthase
MSIVDFGTKIQLYEEDIIYHHKVMKNISKRLLAAEIGIIPTDTIYGVAASAWSEKAVGRAYKALKRSQKKPFIVLIGSIRDLALFKIKLDNNTQKILRNIWPEKVSVILPVTSRKFEYLHRGTKTLAFRVPKKPGLIKLIKKTGPLISTSANPEGKMPAETIADAKKYFGDEIDFYINTGKLASKPSTLLKFKDGKICIMRQGSFQVPKILLK